MRFQSFYPVSWKIMSLTGMPRGARVPVMSRTSFILIIIVQRKYPQAKILEQEMVDQWCKTETNRMHQLMYIQNISDN